jgi:hypothetical protein
VIDGSPSLKLWYCIEGTFCFGFAAEIEIDNRNRLVNIWREEIGNRNRLVNILRVNSGTYEQSNSTIIKMDNETTIGVIMCEC